MNTLGVQRRNKQNIKKFVSIVNEYEQRLDSKVDELVSHIINYSKKVEDPLVLPQIKQTFRSKSRSRTFNAFKKQDSKITEREKSISSSFSFMSEDKISILKKSAAKSFIQQNIPLLPQGRQIGTKKFVKPKSLIRRPDVLSRQIRLDPFAQKNIIKAQDLNKGIMTLIQRGRIGKDVDIITAFQKGGQILSAKQAVFHQGQERITRIQPVKIDKKQQINEQNLPQMTKKTLKIQYENKSWAITMPQNQITLRYDYKKSKQSKLYQKEHIDIQQTSYIKVLHYQTVKNLDLKNLFVRNPFLQSQINSVFYAIKKILERYSIQIAFVSSSKVLSLTSIPRRIKQCQLIGCILSFKDRNRIPLKQIISIREKKEVAALRIQGFFKMIREKKTFSIHLKKRKFEKRISNWLYNRHIMKIFKNQLSTYNKKVINKYEKLQKEFKQKFNQLQNQKHYEILISNKSLEGKSAYKQLLNTQITRIFNFQNSNTHVIIILSEALAEETKNYYYKIMELEQIHNFKERVTFMSVRNLSKLSQKKLSCSQRLYYDSKLMRQIKRRIGSCPSYFRVSYPSTTDIQMSSYYQIPILTGNLTKLLQIQQRSSSSQYFSLPQLTCLRIGPDELKPLSFSSALIQFCQANRKLKNYVVKINGCYQSKGIGLVTYPFDSLPAMYLNTAFIVNCEGSSASQFYRRFCKCGGIVQAFEQSLSSMVLTGKINSSGATQITGTYDKISYGFVNVGYFFPQMTVPNNQIISIFNSVSLKLAQIGHFGDFQINLFVDQKYSIYLDKVQCYITEIGSSLFYFKFLCQGNLNSKGQYITRITETFQTQDNKDEQLITYQPRSYCYLPYILHFGLSDKQVGSFFQLCRMGGISFDLENKYGSTFILLGSLKNSMGMITTARDRQSCRKLMLKSLDFIIKQNSHNNSTQFIEQRLVRMRQRQNILSLKERLQEL